jgi:hypothetical protein
VKSLYKRDTFPEEDFTTFFKAGWSHEHEAISFLWEGDTDELPMWWKRRMFDILINNLHDLLGMPKYGSSNTVTVTVDGTFKPERKD